jgi:hypothetical protein
MDNQTVSPETKQPSKAKKYFKLTVIGIGVLFAILLLALISDISNDPKSETQAEQSTKAEDQQTEQVAVEPFNLEVTSQIVKKVDGKYRYFFDIRNKDTKDFDGKVTINLLKANGNKLGSTTIDEDRAMKPDLGIARFIDANTGPVPIFAADLAITKFNFEVRVDNKVVKTGEGVISDKFEDLN